MKSCQAQKRIEEQRRQRGTLTGGKILLTLGTILLFFFVFTTNTFAANRYWVGTAGGSVASSSNWSGETLP